MTKSAPPRDGTGSAPNPAEVLRRSEHHRRFLEHTLAQRTDELGRAMLRQEWHYYADLMRTRPEDARVLDLACGSGLYSLAWAERGARVTGIDFDRGLLEAGRERVGRVAPGAHPPGWTAGDASRLPFRAGSFDLVFCNSLLEHVPSWEAVVGEAARVLKPGGVFVVYTTNRACPIQAEVNHFPFYSWLPDPIQRRVLAWIMKHRRDLVNWTDFPAVHWFTFGRMRRAFEAAGLEPFDRLDLLARREHGGPRAALARASRAFPPLRWSYQVYAVSMALYGVKRAGRA
ncbi:MAG: class I SAM-dependent methyltransferase [Candidatus Eisenbacteria bacterium]|nr:class I SAM-dependent methyltransferase [Candidatus Eisenbacteria bacterium]